MLKKLNKYMNFSIAISVMLMILGVVVFIYPTVTLNILSYTLSIILILFGIFLVIEDYRFKNLWIVFDFSLLGIILLLLGVILLMYPNTLAILIPIFLGIWFITSGILKFKITSLLKNSDTFIWIMSFLMAILSILCGITFIISPLNSTITFVSFMGVLLFIYSLADIIDMIIFKRNINSICKNLKDDFVITIE